MKIAQISPYDFEHPGGVAEHILHLRDEFQRQGHEVTILAPHSEGGIVKREGFFGVGRTVTIPGNGSKVRLTFDVTLYAQVKALMLREQFDVVHLHEPLVPVLPYMVLLNSRAVNVGTFHAFRESNAWYAAFKPYMSFVMNRLDWRIAVSPPAREVVSQYFEGQFDIVPNGIDPTKYEGIEPLPFSSDETLRILFVGRFNESRKGFKYLLRAMPQVRRLFPSAKLVVVGNGDPARFQGTIDQYGVTGVEFVGFVPTEELPRYYASCDVFCAPSIEGESFGIVLLEAMAAGTPVVAANIPGYASVLTDGEEGLLADPRDPFALALALVRILADKSARATFGARGKVTAQRYAWPEIAARVLSGYEEAAERAGQASWRR